MIRMFRKKSDSEMRAKMNDDDHNRLFMLIEKYKNQIYAQKTDSETNRIKRLTWLKITDEFNEDPQTTQTFSVQKLINHFRNTPAKIKKMQREGKKHRIRHPIPNDDHDSSSDDSYPSSSLVDRKKVFNDENKVEGDPLDETSSTVEQDTPVSTSEIQDSKMDFVTLPDIPEGILMNIDDLISKQAGKVKSQEMSSKDSEFYQNILSPLIKSRLQYQTEQQQQNVKLNELSIKREELNVQLLQEQIKQGRHHHVSKLQRDQELHALRMKHENELHELRMRNEQEMIENRQTVDYNNKGQYSIINLNHQ